MSVFWSESDYPATMYNKQTLSTDIHCGLDNNRPLRVIARSIAELVAVLPTTVAFNVSF